MKKKRESDIFDKIFLKIMLAQLTHPKFPFKSIYLAKVFQIEIFQPFMCEMWALSIYRKLFEVVFELKFQKTSIATSISDISSLSTSKFYVISHYVIQLKYKV